MTTSDEAARVRHPMPNYSAKDLFSRVLAAVLLAPEPQLGLALCALNELQDRYEDEHANS